MTTEPGNFDREHAVEQYRESLVQLDAATA
jgi:hypothetical protein